MNIAIMASSGGSGKDTVAKMIQDLANQQNKSLRIESLGGPIHKACEELMINGKPERQHLQKYGEVTRKIFGENVWMNYLDQKVADGNQDGVIIPDVRKLLEFSHYCVERDYQPLYISCSPEVARQRLLKRDGSYNEASMRNSIETQLKFIEELFVASDLWDNDERGCYVEIAGVKVYAITNDYTEEELLNQVKKWYENAE